MTDISFIVPMYNEEEMIDIFFNKMEETLKLIPQYSYEYICINDGSSDNTLALLKERAKNNKNLKIISFSRNFYKEQALFAGLAEAKGDASYLWTRTCKIHRS